MTFRACAVGSRQMKTAAATEPLLERNEELARIESALAEARRGRGRFLVLEGSAGIGKTALLTAARTVAADGGMRVLRARGTDLERDFAFGVLRQLFEPPLAEASELERDDLLQAAAGVAASLLGLPGAPAANGSPSSSVDPSFAILHGLYWLCANLAAQGPLCLVVDDVHWADAASLRYLVFLLTRLEELDAALIVATRPREAGADAELLAALTTDPSAEVISLPPLTRSAVAQLSVEARRGSGSGLRRCLPARNGRDAVPGARARGGTDRRRNRSDRGGRAPRRTNRCTNGRSLDSAPAPSAARERRAAGSGARRPRAERPSPGGATGRPRRDRGSRGSRAANERWDPRARMAADVRPSDRPQRDLFGALERRARTRPPPCRPTDRRATGRVRARRAAPARQRARGRSLGRRAAGRGRVRRGKAGCSRVGGGLPAPSAR